MAPTVPGFRPLSMRLPNDCGPTALLQALGAAGVQVSYERLLEVWGFREGADRLDTPGHHLRALARLGVGFSVARRLTPRDVLGAVGLGRPVILLVPTGLVRWHWVVVAGGDARAALVSAGDGELRELPWDEIDRARRAGPVGRAFRVDGLGYVVGGRGGPPVRGGLARDMVRLAALAEEALRLVEPAAGLVRGLARKIGWKATPRRGIFSPVIRGEECSP